MRALRPRVTRLPASVLLLGALLLPAAAGAQHSPGPLSSGHEAIDGDGQCQSCHTDGKALSNDKCLGCHTHDPIRKRIAEGKGLHASEKVTGRACYLCHTEHKGRAKDILG